MPPLFAASETSKTGAPTVVGTQQRLAADSGVTDNGGGGGITPAYNVNAPADGRTTLAQG